MPTSLQQADLDDLRKSVKEEVQKLNARIEEVEKSLKDFRASKTLAQTRRLQTDSGWVKKLRAQYDEEVCQNTLEANRLFPVAEE